VLRGGCVDDRVFLRHSAKTNQSLTIPIDIWPRNAGAVIENLKGQTMTDQLITSRTSQRTLGLHVLKVAVGVALIALAAKTQVPFWPVPMTLQTLALMLIAYGYGLRLGGATIVAYLMAGLAGAPVFAGALAGPAYMAGPTAGYLIGFVGLVAVVGLARDRGWLSGLVSNIGVLTLACAVCYLGGFVWLVFGLSMSATAALAAGVVPFLAAEALKIGVAALAFEIARNRIRKSR
jgi:biotin transport system substrate-specific component